MERNQELFEAIERYLANECTLEEKKDIENRIYQIPELKNEVDLHRSLHSELEDIKSLEFRKKLQEISTGLKKNEHNHSSKWRASNLWKVAAVTLFLIGLSTYFWNQSVSQNIKLYESYYNPYPAITPLRGNNGSASMEQAMRLYSNKEYSGAIETLKNIENKDHNNSIIKIYLGNSYLNISKNQDAALSFKNVDKGSHYYEDAQWYLALTYLKMGKFSDTREALKQVINYNGVHKKNAESLFYKLIDLE